MMKLVEMFYSLQGEGLMSGTPSIFIRFGGCNMSCTGFGCEVVSPLDGTTLVGCDTLRAVNVKHFSSSWENINALGMIEKLENFQRSLCLSVVPDIVLTGGEPLLTINDDEFDVFGEYLLQNGYRVTVETNGSLEVDFEKKTYAKEFYFALSVKLASSGEPLKKRVVHDALKGIISHGKSFFKFVLNGLTMDEDIKEIKEIVKFYPSVPLFCMPLGGSKKELEHHSEAVFMVCTQQGWRYSDRLHIRIFDKKERV